MKSRSTAPKKPKTAEQQLKSFIGKFSPAHQKLLREVRAAMRKRLPGANEIVYDNYNFFVIGYGPTERPSDCPFSIAAAANGVRLFFLGGATLKDPHKILLGSGKQVRSIRLESAGALKRPEVDALIDAAVAQSESGWPSGRGKLIIRSISAKQRPRRKPTGRAS